MAQPQPMMQPPPGMQQPTPEQIRQMQAQLAAEAQKAGMTVPQYVEKMKAQMMAQAQAQQQAQQQRAHAQGPQGAQPGQQQPIVPGPPKPEAIAVANFLRSQELKMRTCIFQPQQQRKDMFKVKRAIRALQSDAYEKARKKNPLLPEVKDRVTAENTFKLLPMSLLALRVSKVDPHEGHDHGKKKRVKGLWTVKVEQQQEASDDFYYVMLYEGSQWKNKLYAALALVGILGVVFFPVWPLKLRIGVWYLSMGMLGLLGLFFAMAIFRLILFLVTYFAVPPGLWLYPNLFEDVGFFESFVPLWAWHEDEKAMKKRKKEERERKKARREARANGEPKESKKAAKAAEKTKVEQTSEPSEPVTLGASNTGTTSAEPVPSDGNSTVQQRNLAAQVEEVEDD